MKNKIGWDVISSETVYVNQWYEIREDKVTVTNGQSIVYTYLRHPGSVFIVPVTHDNQIVLIHSYRYPIDKWCWEVPAGTLADQSGQHPTDVAAKEISEEIGAKFSNLLPLGSYYLSNGFANMRCYYFIAEDVKIITKQRLEKGELIDKIILVSLEDANAMVKAGKINDGDSAFALLLALQYLKEKGV